MIQIKVLGGAQATIGLISARARIREEGCHAGCRRNDRPRCRGALAALMPLCPRQAIEQAIRQEVPARLCDINLKALADGYALAAAASSSVILES